MEPGIDDLIGGASEVQLSEDVLVALEQIGPQAQQAAERVIAAMFGKSVAFGDVSVVERTIDELSAELRGTFVRIEVTIDEMHPFFTLISIEEVVPVLDLGFPTGDDWAEQVARLESPATVIVETVNTLLKNQLKVDVPLSKPGLLEVELPQGIDALLLSPAQPVIEITYQMTVPGDPSLGAVTIRHVTTHEFLEIIVGAPDQAAVPVPPGSMSTRPASNPSPRRENAPMDTHARSATPGRRPVPSHLLDDSSPDLLDDPLADMGGLHGLGGSGGQSVRPAQFAQFGTPTDVESTSNIDLILDVNLRVTVELGRTQKSIQEILELAPGSVIELDKVSGEPVDILVNGKPIARGEVVVVDENFGVRVTEIISPVRRVQSLR